MTALLSFVIDAAVRGLVIAVAIGAVLMLIPRAGARLRLRAWTLVLYALLALPVVALVAPVWRSAVPAVPVFDNTQAVQSVAVLQTPASLASTAAAFPVASTGPQWPVVGSAIYAIGLACLCFQAVVGWRFVRRLQKRVRGIEDAPVLVRLERHRLAAGIRTPPILTESPDLFSPVTMFVRRPMVVLPDDWRAWPAEQLDGVLAHELSHVARHDALTQRLALIYRAVFWFSPLSWWLQRHLSRLAELASDESALAAGVEPLAYADALLAFFVRAQNHPRRAAWHLAMARRDDADAARRIERILSWKGGPSMARMKLILTGVGVVIAPLTVLAASVHFAPTTLPAIVAPMANMGVVTPLPPAKAPAVPMAVSIPKPVPLLPAAVQTPTPQPAVEPQKSEDDLEFLKGAYELNTPRLIKPVAVTDVKPRYTSQAMREKLQGVVSVEIIIAADGTVSKARVIVSLDKVYGLDDEALRTAKQWVFTPGTLDGQPVPVHTILMLEFRLH